MRTETELKKTWCPWARAIVLGTGDFGDFQLAINRTDKGGGSLAALCIGFSCSQCVDCGPKMELGPAYHSAIHKTADDDPDKPKGEGWTVVRSSHGSAHWTRDTGERHVYCGRNTGEALRHELAGLSDMIFNALNNR